MLTVGVLFGGRSGEHDVSLCSAASVAEALDRARYRVVAVGIDREGRWHVQDEPTLVQDPHFGKILKLEPTGEWYVRHFPSDGRLHLFERKSGREAVLDVVFPVVHGTNCEDGRLQGLLELAMVPYVGADVAGSAVGIDKDIAKRLLREAGIPVVPWMTVRQSEWNKDPKGISSRLILELGLPLFIKPANTGSSVGIKKVKKDSELAGAIDFGLQFDSKILVESGLDVREIECAVLGNEDPQASVPGEVIPRHEFYSYESKYLDADGAELVIPASLDEATASSVRETAVKAYQALNCCGMARVDFFLEKSGPGIYLNEINTLPGFTSISMYPKLWASTGISYTGLLDKLIALALERQQERMRISTTLHV